MAIDDKVYTFGFFFLSAVYWLAFALSVTGRRDSPIRLEDEIQGDLSDIEKAHVPAVYLLGAILYTFATATFGTNLDDLFGIRNISALFTQMAALSWNFAIIFLALYWSENSRRYKNLKTRLLVFYLAGLGGTTFCFALAYPGPTGLTKNYILSGASTLAGTFYLLIYTTTVMLTKVILIIICIPQIRKSNEKIMQTSLSLAVVGSCLLILFACFRSTNPFSFSIGIDPHALEPFAFFSQMIGATLVAVGFSLPRISSLRKGMAEWSAYYRVHRILAPMAEAAGRLSSTFKPTTTRLHPQFFAWSLCELKVSVHRDLIAILDAASMGKSDFVEAMAYHDQNGPQESLGSAHLDRFGAVVTVAKKYNSLLRMGVPWQKAYDAAILPSASRQ